MIGPENETNTLRMLSKSGPAAACQVVLFCACYLPIAYLKMFVFF